MTTKKAHAGHKKEIEALIDAGHICIGVNVDLSPAELVGYPEAVIAIKVENAAKVLTDELTRAVERWRVEQETQKQA